MLTVQGLQKTFPCKKSKHPSGRLPVIAHPALMSLSDTKGNNMIVVSWATNWLYDAMSGKVHPVQIFMFGLVCGMVFVADEILWPTDPAAPMDFHDIMMILAYVAVFIFYIVAMCSGFKLVTSIWGRVLLGLHLLFIAVKSTSSFLVMFG